MRTKQFPHLLITIICLFTSVHLHAGEVYLVLGSDTAIWDSMNTSRFHCTYRSRIYTAPSDHGYRVMDASFRNGLRDSYDQPMKLTWWMMAGNIFRYATNTNVPIPNIMTLYFMKKHHLQAIQYFGDELSLHYHTFQWYDFDGDGRAYWNQAQRFLDCREDFDFTIAQFLSQEDVFPVSFRSGWHYMDNDWQRYLNELLPYSMHNDWPAKRLDLTEPLDNTYDWSQSPSTFVPFHPDVNNYQIPGNGPGWNIRSKHISSVTQEMMNTIFSQAAQGIDQVACLWGHLPETDFLDNLTKINDLAHAAAEKYPSVRFRYCSAIEAMQRWRGCDDHKAPQLTITAVNHGTTIGFIVTADEPIFQPRPIIAMRDIFDDYRLISSTQQAVGVWQTDALPKGEIAKISAAVCDTAGNLATVHFILLPDDIFFDDSDPEYTEIAGAWQNYTDDFSWNQMARIATIQQGSTAARWTLRVPQEHPYHIYIRSATIPNPTEQTIFRIFQNGQKTYERLQEQALPADSWYYVGTCKLYPQKSAILEVEAPTTQKGKILAMDAVKLSALVRPRDLFVQPASLDLGVISQEDTTRWCLQLINRGTEPVTVYGLSVSHLPLETTQTWPVVLLPAHRLSMPLGLKRSTMTGVYQDTLYLQCNDPAHAAFKVPVSMEVLPYFAIIDNADCQYYREIGDWRYSVTQAYGANSRYAPLGQKPPAQAWFEVVLAKSGFYEIFEIVPTTVNSSDRALYTFYIQSIVLDSVFVNQNEGSGDWRRIARYFLPAGVPIQVRVTDGGSSPSLVLRADAIKFQLQVEISEVAVINPQPNDHEIRIGNYPNPFNPNTVIRFYLPQPQEINLTIHDVRGVMLRQLAIGDFAMGWHEIPWMGEDDEGRPVASGLYFYRLRVGKEMHSGKMLKVK